MGDNESLSGSLGPGEPLPDHDSGFGTSLTGDEQEGAGVEEVGTPNDTTAPDGQQQQQPLRQRLQQQEKQSMIKLLEALTIQVTGSQQGQMQIILSGTAGPRPEVDGEWTADSLLRFERELSKEDDRVRRGGSVAKTEGAGYGLRQRVASVGANGPADLLGGAQRRPDIYMDTAMDIINDH